MGIRVDDAGVALSRRGPDRLRLAVAVVALAVLLAGAGHALLGATQIGISTDEPNHQSRMDEWFDHGWYLPARFMEDGQPREDIAVGRLHAYGAGYSIFGHAVAVAAGAEEWGTTNRTGEAYIARGISVALLGIAAALAVGYSLMAVTGSWLVGLWSSAAVMALPLWTGYSMFAVKDVPSGTGWTFVSAALVVATIPGSPRRRVSVGCLMAVGVWFSIGVRTALWVPVLLALLVFAVLVGSRRHQPAVVRQAIGIAVGGAAGLLAVMALHYRNAATPIDWLMSSVRTSGDFHWVGTTLSAGQLVTEKPPWWYLPGWVGGSVPLMLGALALLGAGLGISLLVQRRLRDDSAATLLWVHQAFTLPLAATVTGATMYAGMRQHLYVLPALAALSGFAAHRAAKRVGHRPIVAVLAVAVLLVPLAEQTQLAPYQFVYKNAFAGQIDDNWETDMHLVSGREALAGVPAAETARCYTNPLVLEGGEASLEQGVTGCRSHRLFGPFIRDQGSAVSDDAPRGDGVWVIGRRYGGNPPIPSCVEQANITRPLRTQEVTLSYVLLCPGSILDN